VTFRGVEIRHLRYFVVVYEQLHFRRAAEELHMAQPPLSRAIRALEEELDVKLFRRAGRGIEPTQAGHLFADYARRAIESFDLAIAQGRLAEDSSTLRVGCTPYLRTSHLQAFLDALKAREPKARAQVTHLPSPDQIRHLRNGDLDFSIAIAGEDYDDIASEHLFQGEPVLVLLRRDHRLAEKLVVRPKDLYGETCLKTPRAINPVVHDKMQAVFDDAGFRFERIHDTVGLDPRDFLIAIMEGLGIAFGPSWLREMDGDGESIVARPIDPPIRMPDTAILWLAEPPATLEAWHPVLRDVARELYQAPVPVTS
jgi:LysR family transcriptional regulator, benzoate and cis,cis-muconate-responsive activator of ben and cat genes